MIKSQRRILTAVAGLALAMPAIHLRARTQDISFTFRMGAGFPGDVNRTHPASILPGLMDATNPIRRYGDPALVNAAANSYRGIVVGDTAGTNIAGVLVRPYPIQQQTGGMAASIGAATPPQAAAAIDILREGYIMAMCNNFGVNAPAKGGAVHIWYTADSGQHKQGGFEAAATASNTFLVGNAKWLSPADSTGVAELEVWAG